jgi:hypothetical protein
VSLSSGKSLYTLQSYSCKPHFNIILSPTPTNRYPQHTNPAPRYISVPGTQVQLPAWASNPEYNQTSDTLICKNSGCQTQLSIFVFCIDLLQYVSALMRGAVFSSIRYQIKNCMQSVQPLTTDITAVLQRERLRFKLRYISVTAVDLGQVILCHGSWTVAPDDNCAYVCMSSSQGDVQL